MKEFKLIHETPSHFVLHNGLSHFHVAKNGINEATADKIRSFAQGGSTHADGSTRAGDKTQAINKKEMAAIDSKIAAKKYDEGGAVEQKESFHLEDPAKSDLDIYKSTELPEPEKQEKRRQIEVDMPEPTAHADGGEVQKDDGIKPMEEVQMFRHGQDVTNPNDRAEYSAMKQLKKESPSIPMYDDGGEVSTFTKIGNAIKQSFEKPTPEPTPSADYQREAKYAAVRQQNSENMKGGSSYADGGDVTPSTDDPNTYSSAFNKNKSSPQGPKPDISGQGQSTKVEPFSKGGHVHHNGGKNQLHFHFYDGATIPTQLDKEEGAGPQQSSPLDKYVGGEPMAEGGEPSVNLSPSDIDPNAAVNVPQNANPNALPQDATADQQSVATPQNTVPNSQQISAAPKAAAPTPDQNPSMLSDFDKSLAQEKQGIEEGATAQSEGFKNTAQALGQHDLEQRKENDDFKLASDAITQQNQQLFDAVKDNRIDPNHFWNSKTTGGKIAATIGLLLGGIGGGLDQTHQNKALVMLQNHIANDIDAQKVDNSNKMNLYKMGLEKYHDTQSAAQFATLQSNALLQGTLQKIAAQTGSAQAAATAKQMIGTLGVQNAGIRSDLAMKQAAMGAMNSPNPAGGGVDSNKLRLLVSAGVIPKEEVPAAMKEYGDYQKLGGILNDTDKTFDIGKNNANWRQALLPHWTPDITQASKRYDAAIDNFLGKITKETEGRVTPADVELMRPSMPNFTDDPKTAQQKINTVKDQIKEKFSFPTLTTYKMLHPNDPTTSSSATRQKKFTEGPAR